MLDQELINQKLKLLHQRKILCYGGYTISCLYKDKDCLEKSIIMRNNENIWVFSLNELLNVVDLTNFSAKPVFAANKKDLFSKLSKGMKIRTDERKIIGLDDIKYIISDQEQISLSEKIELVEMDDEK